MPRSGVEVQGSSNNSRGRLLQPFDYMFVLNALPYILSFITVICDYHSIQDKKTFSDIVRKISHKNCHGKVVLQKEQKWTDKLLYLYMVIVLCFYPSSHLKHVDCFGMQQCNRFFYGTWLAWSVFFTYPSELTVLATKMLSKRPLPERK